MLVVRRKAFRDRTLGKDYNHGRIESTTDLEFTDIEEVEDSKPRLAQILTINPRYIWGSGVFNTSMSTAEIETST